MNRGIQFFQPGTSDDVKRRRWTFLAVWIFSGLMVIWPLFPWFGARQALVLGLPASIAWIVLALAIQFAALLWLYLKEEVDEEDAVSQKASSKSENAE